LSVIHAAPISVNGLSTAPSVTVVLEEHRSGIEQRGVERSEIRRGIHSRDLRLVEPHRPPIVLHRHNFHVGVDQLRAGEKAQQFARRQPVPQGNGILPDERRERRIENVALDTVGANRIRTVENDDRLLHGVCGERQCPFVRVDPRPDV
jgi:hypothetical protein